MQRTYKIEYTLRIISPIKKHKFSSTGDVLILPSCRYQSNGRPRVIAALPSKSREQYQLWRVQGTGERGVCFSLNPLFYIEVLLILLTAPVVSLYLTVRTAH